MNKTNFTKFLLLIFLSLVLLPACMQINRQEKEENDKYDGPDKAAEFEFNRTKDPVTGIVPAGALLKAMYYTDSLKKVLPFQFISGYGNWTERGPNSDAVGTSNGNTRANSGVASGRIRTILVDAADATGKTVYVGGVAGGLWKTTDITASPATWTFVNDFFSNMAITSICQDPTNSQIMYFGTGEGNYNADAVRGVGVWKTTDGGATWNQLTSTTGYLRCTKIVCDASGNIYLGDRNTGLLRSTDGGTNWTNITPAGAGIVTVADIEIGSTGRMHISIGLVFDATSYYYYTNNPSTTTTATSATNWILPTTPFPTTITDRIELACSGNTVFALPSSSATDDVATIYKSTDGGVTWAATATTPAFTSGQGWYCLAIDIDPSNSNNVIVGSLDCFKTTDGGTSWSQISTWVGTTPVNQYVHADQHIIKWYDNGNKLLIGCDGGIHYSSDKGTTIRDRNVGLRIKQFYSVAIHPSTTNYFLGGAQDNGSHKFSSAGLGATVEVTGGDGAFVKIDQKTPANQFTSYVYNQYRRSTNSGATWTTTNLSTTLGQFINPIDYDTASTIMYCGNSAGNYRRWTNPLTGTTSAAVTTTALNGNSVTAITVDPYTTNRVYFGTTNDIGTTRLCYVDAANTVVSPAAGTNISTGLPTNTTTSCVAVGTNDNNLMVCYSNYGVQQIWVSINVGTAWTNIDGDLPDMPVRWCMFVPGTNTAAIIATEAGVYVTTSINGSFTTWFASPSFPTVRTDMLQYRSSDKLVAAATHGRGLWTQPYYSIVPSNNFLLRGKWTGNTAQLAWEYDGLTAGASMDIEISTDPVHFVKVGNVPYAGSKYYSFLHTPAQKNVYYRIKSHETTGAEKYSNTIKLFKNGTDVKPAITALYPNPVGNDLKLAFTIPQKGRTVYMITSISGQTIWRKEEELQSVGAYLKSWNITGIKPGAYLFTVILQGGSSTQKFIKQ